MDALDLQVDVIRDGQVQTQRASLQRDEHDARVDAVELRSIPHRRARDARVLLPLTRRLCLTFALALLRLRASGSVVIPVINEVVVVIRVIIAHDEVIVLIIIGQCLVDDDRLR